MELWEFNHCLKAYSRKQQSTGKERLATSWYTANLTGAAFGGKLRKLSYYMDRVTGDRPKAAAPKISKEEFEAKLRLIEDEERRRQGGA